MTFIYKYNNYQSIQAPDNMNIRLKGRANRKTSLVVEQWSVRKRPNPLEVVWR